MVLMATDLPEPVVPAISRCGMRARSTSTGSPPIDLPRQSGSRCGGVVVIARRQQLAQIDFLARRIRQFDADGVAARHHGDARRQRAHRARDVVGEADDARRFDAGRGLEFVERDHRAGPRIDDLAAHAEIAEHAFERRGVFLQGFAAHGGAADLARLRQQFERRQLIAAARPARLRRARFARCARLGVRHQFDFGILDIRARSRRAPARRSAARCAARGIAASRARPGSARGAPAEQPRNAGAQAQHRMHHPAERNPSRCRRLRPPPCPRPRPSSRHPRRPARRAR